MRMRSNLDNKLDNLNKLILEMAMYDEKAIDLSIDLLKAEDEEKAKQVIDYEKKTDKLEEDIKQLGYRIILEEQPVASDLRKVSSGIQIATDLERIGDQVRDIAEISLNIDRDGIVNYLNEVKNMARETTKLLNDSINAFVHRDIELASEIEDRDDIIDDAFVSIRDKVVDGIKTGEITGGAFVDIIMIAKYLERIADHAVNISEWVEFIVEG